ncbi:hypothetical protein GBAR_LOCUS20858 [Geodia barretti]|nr:hypothetical protein GBAR_LOCUS20858 [Geodia barretti]
MRIPSTGCVVLECLVEGGRAGWDIGKGQAFQAGVHQNISLEDGIYTLHYVQFVNITANYSGDYSELSICGTGVMNKTVISVACFAYHFNDFLLKRVPKPPSSSSSNHITVEVHDVMDPKTVKIKFFKNSTSVHLECKDIDSNCLFLFDGKIPFVLQNNTEECVDVSDNNRLGWISVYQIDRGKVGHALDWHQHVMNEDQLQLLCPSGTNTSDPTAIDNSTATTSSAAGPLIAALAALVSLAVVN